MLTPTGTESRTPPTSEASERRFAAGERTPDRLPIPTGVGQGRGVDPCRRTVTPRPVVFVGADVDQRSRVPVICGSEHDHVLGTGCRSREPKRSPTNQP